jgi:hypothetical protein
MSEVFRVAIVYPTAIFTILVGIALVYWLFVILGAVDIDTGGDADMGDVGHGGADVGHGGADVDAGADADADAGSHGHGALVTVLAALGLRRVPIPITFSFLSLFAWIICIFLMLFLGDSTGLPRWIVGSLVLVASVVLALPPTAVVSRPLAPLFRIHEAKRRAHYVGATCEIVTGTVSARFGQARIEAGGDVLNIQVRCDGENTLGRKHKALIIAYDDTRHAFLVEPMHDVLHDENAADPT